MKMKKLFRFNNNICDQILKEANIHFTKSCPNKCPFCIDAFNTGFCVIYENGEILPRWV